MSGRWIKTTNVIASEIEDRDDFSGVLKYAAGCIRACASRTYGEDDSETDAKRYNMRTLARRLESVARSLEGLEVRRQRQLRKSAKRKVER